MMLTVSNQRLILALIFWRRAAFLQITENDFQNPNLICMLNVMECGIYVPSRLLFQSSLQCCVELWRCWTKLIFGSLLRCPSLYAACMVALISQASEIPHCHSKRPQPFLFLRLGSDTLVGISQTLLK